MDELEAGSVAGGAGALHPAVGPPGTALGVHLLVGSSWRGAVGPNRGSHGWYTVLQGTAGFGHRVAQGAASRKAHVSPVFTLRLRFCSAGRLGCLSPRLQPDGL